MPFDIIHSGIWTPPVLSNAGHKYYVLFVDEFSDFLWTFPLASKSDVFSKFLQLFKYILTQFQRPIKNLQCDNGREYDNNIFRQFCQIMVYNFVSLVHTPLPKMGKQNDQSVQSIIWSTPFSIMRPFQCLFYIML